MRFKEIALLSIVFSGAAHAGPYADEMSKCLVDSTTKEDRIALVRWMFTAAAANPAVAPIAKVSAQTMDEANTTMGALLMKLLTESCKDKTKAAIKYEGPVVMQLSFQVLGQVAARELFASPEVNKAISGLQAHVDPKKLEQLKDE